MNRLIHICCQVNLERLPAWEIWSLKQAPNLLRERFEALVYLEQHENTCIFCAGEKERVTTMFRKEDAGLEITKEEKIQKAAAFCRDFYEICLTNR